ncbi:3-dehydroquinate synthase [Corynebacterium sphenisci DSM 44792]|uniref:3-dehydroquinate synthase n=1 Tax=Corynebacterium sphenisci DSM 44792 TaxID=1437874 RepID=A0A1L7CY12_9CORY|nr:3-dehydroquinate synthase [Corynebacterium sphenisci]APT90702.1 3-dehydroquinate synthase [Corynebacterium sphenisci DSM 44792]
MSSIIEVRGPDPYRVTVDHGLVEAIAAAATAGDRAVAAVVHQPTVAGYAARIAEAIEARGVAAARIGLPDAEEGKTLEVAGACWDAFGERGLGRGDAVVAVGGGAATDLGGFLAAGWMRGIDVIQVPTTLLGMVDAAVGGKTGVNTAAGKNLVGAFHEPRAVFADLDQLRTLPEAEIVAGSAEIIKAGFIDDPVILDRYEADPAACLDVDRALPELIARAIAVKAEVVAADLREAGLRETLNYGHTFGHAVELHERYRWRHGHAVAVGMVYVAELAAHLGMIGPELLARHRRILESVGLPTTYAPGLFDELHAAMTRDKKNRGGRLRFVAVTRPGECTRIEAPAEEALRAAYAALCESGRPARTGGAR